LHSLSRSKPKLTRSNNRKSNRPKASFEIHRQAALRLNEMAQNIHSEADARKFVDGVEEELFGHGGPIQSKLRSFITRSMRRRVPMRSSPLSPTLPI